MRRLIAFLNIALSGQTVESGTNNEVITQVGINKFLYF